MLACAHSNVAADNLLDGLLKQGVSVVRLGERETQSGVIVCGVVWCGVILFDLI